MRKKQSKKRDLIPDPKFNDQLVTRFVNNLMQQGKKSTAYKIFYDAIDIIESKKKIKKRPLLICGKMLFQMLCHKWKLEVEE